MSGLEVVGVVLATIPLIINVVDKYKSTSQRLRFFRLKEPYIAQLVQSLEEQKFFLETDLRLTLKGTHLEDDEVTALLTHPNERLFGDPEVAHAVKAYLGDGYDPYTAVATRCYQALADIVKHISGLTSDPEVDLSRLVQAYPRKNGKYDIDKESLEHRIKALDASTKALQRVRDYSSRKSEVAVQSTSKVVSKFTAALNMIRRYADRLYSAISLGYAANCHPEHEAQLFLQSRSRFMEKARQSSQNDRPFTFAVRLRPVSTINRVSCLKVEIKVLNEDSLDSLGLLPSPGDSNTSKRIDMKPDAERSKRVMILAATSPSKGTSHPRSNIHDICRCITDAHSEKKHIDLHLSQEGYLCYGNTSVKAGTTSYAVDQNIEDIVSLD